VVVSFFLSLLKANSWAERIYNKLRATHWYYAGIEVEYGQRNRKLAKLQTREQRVKVPQISKAFSPEIAESTRHSVEIPFWSRGTARTSRRGFIFL
jgi:hypothetical protein